MKKRARVSDAESPVHGVPILEMLSPRMLAVVLGYACITLRNLVIVCKAFHYVGAAKVAHASASDAQ